MNNFWRGAFLLVLGVYVFFVVIFRPKYLKSVKRSGSRYHVSRLGATSCGLALLTMGIAGIFNGLNMLPGVYVESVFLLAIGQLLAVGIYDSYRNSRLDRKSPRYVKLAKDKVTGKDRVLSLAHLLMLIGVFAGLIHFIFPTLDNGSIRLFAIVGVLPLACVVAFFTGFLR
jgi:hypothetical protein